MALNIFTVDDSDLIQTRLAQLLDEIDGVTLRGQAFTVSEALDYTRSFRPEVVILDIRLPDGNGLDVLTALKRADNAPVVIILTGYAYPQYEEQCITLGADYFLDKMTGFERLPDLLTHIHKKNDNETQ